MTPATPRTPGTRARPRGEDDVAELRRRLDDQAGIIADLAERVDELEGLLRRTTQETLRRIGELRPAAWNPTPAGDPGAPAPVPAGETPVPPAAAVSDVEYRRPVTRIRALVRTTVPPGAVVAVASRGDDILVDLDGRTGWHFPRTGDGRYAGHHPKDSAAAIGALEDLHRQGARFVLFPATARWWLDYYAGLRRHLEATTRVVVDHADACVLYEFQEKSH